MVQGRYVVRLLAVALPCALLAVSTCGCRSKSVLRTGPGRSRGITDTARMVNEVEQAPRVVADLPGSEAVAQLAHTSQAASRGLKALLEDALGPDSAQVRVGSVHLIADDLTGADVARLAVQVVDASGRTSTWHGDVRVEAGAIVFDRLQASGIFVPRRR